MNSRSGNAFIALMYFLIGAFILMNISSCTPAIKKEASLESDPDPVTLTSSPQTDEAKTAGSVIFSVDGSATATERALISQASDKVRETVASQCFQDFISKRPMIQTNGKTPSEVASHVRSLTGIITVSMYFKKWSSAVAYRQPPEMKINLNRSFFTARKTPCEWASTMAHEGLGHALGSYEHSFKPTKDRDLSVPYSLNRAFELCCH